MLDLKKNYQILKNLLIFFPIIISNKVFSLTDIINLSVTFCLFSFMTLIIYNINDFIDFDIDKKNVLKLKSKKISLKNFLVLNFILLCIILIFFVSGFNIKYVILYLALFYFYSLYLKQIKYFDLLCLAHFYIFRVFFGADIIEVNISLFFYLFLLFSFLILSFSKRIYQININNLKNKNRILPYSKIDLPKFKSMQFILSLLSILTLVTYINNWWFLKECEQIYSFFFNSYTIINKDSNFYFYLALILIIKLYLDLYKINFSKKKYVNNLDFFNYILKKPEVFLNILLISFLIVLKKLNSF